MPTQWSEAEQVPLGCIAPHGRRKNLSWESVFFSLYKIKRRIATPVYALARNDTARKHTVIVRADRVVGPYNRSIQSSHIQKGTYL